MQMRDQCPPRCVRLRLILGFVAYQPSHNRIVDLGAQHVRTSEIGLSALDPWRITLMDLPCARSLRMGTSV